MNQGFAALLLLVSLFLLLASTRQAKLWLRSVVWSIGVGCIIGGIALVASDNHSGLFRVAVDFADHIGDPGESVLGQALERNGPSVTRFILPLLDFFLLIGLVLAALALVAFTPGETLEKITRPLAIGLIGAMFGGAASLAIVGMGFGDFRKQRVYADEISSADVERAVYDGDTFWIGEVSLRLNGVDAPELNQICLDAEGRRDENCGERARDRLGQLLGGRLVVCEAISDRRPDDSFGRPLTACRAGRRDADDEQDNRAIDDLGRELVRFGYAVDYDPPDDNRGQSRGERLAVAERANLLAGCILRPKRWRRHPDERRRFLAHDFVGLDVIGAACPQIAQQRTPPT